MDDIIKEIINNGESQSVEFKSSFQKDVIETIVAFANTKGGKIYIGITDGKKISGVHVSEETVQNYINTIKQNTTPTVIPDVEIIEVDNKKILVIDVLEYPIKPIAYKGRFYKRRQNSNHLMTPVEISDAHIKMMNSSWDFYQDPYHTLNDISEDKVKKFMKMAKIDDSVQTILNKFELVKDNSITFGCYLLFTNNDKAIMTSIELGRFASETIIKDGYSIYGDLFSEIEQVMDFVYKHTNKAYIISGAPQRKERWDYPMDAIREIVINMIVHRDYRSSGHSVVKIFDDRIEFFNYGTLPPDLSIENIKSGHYKSIPRNLQIANIFKEAEIIEKYGSGIKRIIESFKAYGLAEPVFEEMQGGFHVVVYKNDVTNQNKTSAKLANESSVKSSVKILELMEREPTITIPLLSLEIGITQRAVEKQIAKLQKEGLVKRIGPD